MEFTGPLVNLLQATASPWQSDWIWGCPLIILTVAIHTWGLSLTTRRAMLLSKRNGHHTIMAAIGIGLLTLSATLLHAIEAGIWAISYQALGAVPDFRSAMLYSLGSLTTYGQHSVYLETRWSLLGSIEALNGWLLFGLSTAFLFWVIQDSSPKLRALN
jgi:hypothetical protein